MVMLGVAPNTSPTVVMSFRCNSFRSIAVIAIGTSCRLCSNLWAVTVTLSSVATSSATARNDSTVRMPINLEGLGIITPAERAWPTARSAARFGLNQFPVMTERERAGLPSLSDDDGQHRGCSQEVLLPRRRSHGFSTQPAALHSPRLPRERMTSAISPRSYRSSPTRYEHQPPRLALAMSPHRFFQ